MVNYYTCSQYLTGPAPCPSVQHPDSTPTDAEGRAGDKHISFVPCAKYVFNASHGLEGKKESPLAKKKKKSAFTSLWKTSNS